MKAEQWQQVERIYHAALESGAEGRAAFLSEACAGDEELRREVESLLAYDDQAGDFIESPALEEAAKTMAAELDAAVVSGQTINHYKVLSPLGAGGMGEVYLAEDTRLHRKVALKFLPAHFTQDRSHLRRFEQEARAIAALSHPNVCMIHEVVETAGRHCIVMEYVEGVTLRDRMADGRMNVAEALDAAIQVASALAAAHAAGIVHRDIKLENIMLRPDGYVKTLDFGLAKLTEPPDTLDAEARRVSISNTFPGIVVGTTKYMSPEQARGLQVDERTDVWSLGVVLYELVAGQPPFDGSTPTDVVIAIAGREPEPLTTCVPEVPLQLERIVKKALAKDRAQRYQTAKDLLVDLKSLRRELEIESEVARYKQPTGSSGPAATIGNRQVITSRFFPFRLTRSRILILTALMGMLIIAGLAALFFRHSATPAPKIEIKSLVVLPLENLSDDPAQEYFADGLTDALIGDLAKIGELRVISRTSSMHFKGTKKSLPEIAGELQVDAVVEGTVQRSGERVRIRAQLIHAPTDRHLWVETYERDVRDVLDLQSQIAQAIAREVHITITPAEQARLTPRQPVHPKAFDDYLQGRHLLWNKRTDENVGKAIEYFRSAIREDPTYARAYAGLADSYNALGTVQMGVLPPLEARQRAEEAAVKALELDGGLAEAHVVLGSVNHFNWKWTAAEQDFKRAIELNPNYANAHMAYASYLMSRGSTDEAIAASNRARELDPLSLGISAMRGFLLENARRYDEAIEQLRRVIAMDPNNYVAHWFLGHTHAANGQFDEGVVAAEKAVALSARAPGALGFLGLAYGLAGRKDEATRILNELLALNERRYVTPAAIANVYIGLGDKDQSFVWLEKAYQERSGYIVWLNVFPIVDPLRSDARFADLVRRVGLPN